MAPASAAVAPVLRKAVPASKRFALGLWCNACRGTASPGTGLMSSSVTSSTRPGRWVRAARHAGWTAPAGRVHVKDTYTLRKRARQPASQPASHTFCMSQCQPACHSRRTGLGLCSERSDRSVPSNGGLNLFPMRGCGTPVAPVPCPPAVRSGSVCPCPHALACPCPQFLSPGSSEGRPSLAAARGSILAPLDFMRQVWWRCWSPQWSRWPACLLVQRL